MFQTVVAARRYDVLVGAADGEVGFDFGVVQRLHVVVHGFERNPDSQPRIGQCNHLESRREVAPVGPAGRFAHDFADALIPQMGQHRNRGRKGGAVDQKVQVVPVAVFFVRFEILLFGRIGSP